MPGFFRSSKIRSELLVLIIRDELGEDEQAIHALTEVAFAPMWFSDGSEAPIIRRLRTSGDLTISLVAEIDGRVVGHVAFSPVTIDGVHGGWFGLGPISVEPALQRNGIGKALIAEGIRRLRSLRAAGCALIGNPEIYGKVGFESDGLLTYEDLDPALVQRLVISGPAPKGELVFAAAFSQTKGG
jgi:putative acetyltransferase